MVNSNLPFGLSWNYTNNYQNLIQPRKEEMSYPAIIEYLKALAKIYLRSSKKKKTQLLDTAEEITGRHRKSLTRILNSNTEIISNKKNVGEK